MFFWHIIQEDVTGQVRMLRLNSELKEERERQKLFHTSCIKNPKTHLTLAEWKKKKVKRM